jgi:hypothetical protein
MATLVDLEAWMLAASNVLGACQREIAETVREHTATLGDHTRRLDSLASKVGDTNQRARSLEENTAEIKDLLVRALDR